MKKVLKKSDVLKEGYIKGLREAQRIINEMMQYDQKVSEIQSWLSFFTLKVNQDEQDFLNREDEAADEIIENAKTPYVDMRDEEMDLRVNVAEIDSIVYDRDTDTLTFDCYAGNYSIPNFKTYWTKEPYDWVKFNNVRVIDNDTKNEFDGVKVEFSLQ